MANRIAGHIPATNPQLPPSSRLVRSELTPVVSNKPRPDTEKLSQGGEGFYNFLELGPADSSVLVAVLASTRAASAFGGRNASPQTIQGDVRQAVNKMRFYLTSCMFGRRVVGSEDYALLARFSQMWGELSPDQRAGFAFGDEFDRFVAGILSQAAGARPTVVSREANGAKLGEKSVPGRNRL